MTTREVLVAARKLIEDPDRWAGRAPFLEQETGKYCALTAIAAYADPFTMREPCKAFAKAIGRHGASGSVIRFNDSHTHAEVLAAFDKAIAGCDQ